MNHLKPKVSVILPVYNAEDFIHEAIYSILDQTLREFEFIILNDGSTDNTDKIIRSFKDPRIRYFSRDNMGLSFTLNEMLDLAQSELIARMDADDISYPNRLLMQYNEFIKNPNLVLVGGNVNYINVQGLFIGRSLSPSSNKAVKEKLKKGNVIFHPTTMFKKNACIDSGKYSLVVEKYIEDYLLWMSMLKHGEVKVLPDIVLSYRVHDGAISSEVPTALSELVSKICENKGAYKELSVDYARMISGDYVKVERKFGYKFTEVVRRLIIRMIDFYFFAKKTV